MITVTFHISCKKHSLTKTRDVVSVSKHNLRLFQSEEYNEEMIEVEVGSEVNILDDVKEIYEREFSEALAEYNKGKRSDRQIHDYLEYVSESKKNDVATEVILQVGDKEFWADKTREQWNAMKPLLREQLEYVKEIVPEFKIASAVTHLDEDSPHMHVVGVPVATGYKRGLSKQVAKTKVFDQERLEKIQDLMHDFVEHQMKDHPEIFGDETLMKKEFMRYATLENPKTTLGKIVSKAFKTFKEWWDKTKKPEIAEKAKTSILQKLRESQAIVDQRKEQQGPNLKRNNLSPER